MVNNKYSKLVKYTRSGEEYYIDFPIDNQTFHMGFQLVEGEDPELSKTEYYNVWINLYNKRKDMWRNEDLLLSTGLNPIKTVLVARECFKAIEAEILEDMEYNDKDVIIYCHWVNNRRRDAYYKVLSRMGYRYGRIPLHPYKVIMKRYKNNENK